MIDNPEKIAFARADSETNPPAELPKEVLDRIDEINRKAIEAIKEGTMKTRSDRFRVYCGGNRRTFRNKLITFIARKIDNLQDFNTYSCARTLGSTHERVLGQIDETLTIAEKFGLQVMEPVKSKLDTKGPQFFVYEPIENPSRKPEKEVPVNFKPGTSVIDSIRLGLEFIPTACHELLFFLYMNSKNLYLLNYEEMQESLGLTEGTVRSKLKILKKYLPKIGIELYGYKSAYNQKIYYGIAKKGGDKHLIGSFNKAEKKRQSKAQKAARKAARRKELEKIESKPRVTSKTLILQNFKMPDSNDPVYNEEDTYFSDYLSDEDE